MTASRSASGPAHVRTDVRLVDPDAFYEALIDMHRDLSAEASALVNAKLILLLANHIGDLAVLREAMALARQDVAAGDPDISRVVIPNKET